jgi:thymidylate synthase (FAD)
MKSSLHVLLLEHTPNPENLIASAAKLCYSAAEIKNLVSKQNTESSRKFIDKLMQMGHQSPLEHISYTFGIEGISRACSHQLVRHRIASYSQQSQRYVGETREKHGQDCFNFIVPETIQQAGLEPRFIEMMQTTQGFYNELSEELKKRLDLTGESNFQDARYVLPNAAETKLIATMNARELLHFFALRTCMRAQWEIRALAKEMYKLVLPTAPTLFDYAGPSCVTKGKCSEGKASCGLANQVREEFCRLRKS